MSREVAAMGNIGRETARLRASEIDILVDLTREGKSAGEPARAPAPGAASKATPPTAPKETPHVAPKATREQTPLPLPPARHRGFELPLALGVLLLTGVIVLGYVQTRRSEPTPPVPSATIAPAPTIVATAAPPAIEPPTPAADVRARQALERLRSGLDGCIRTRIRALPGSSPAVPPTLLAFKESAYTPAPADWKTPVWSCAQFQMSEPMDFQMQWQHVNPSPEGKGVAWIDQDHDGVADRALGFSITLAPSGAPILGEIQPIAAATPVSAARR